MLGAFGAGGARQPFLNQHEVDLGVGVQRIDAGHEIVGAAQHPEAAVDRIADQRADRQHGVEPVRGGGRQRRKLEPVALGGVDEEPAIGARQRDGAETAAGRRAGMHQELRDLDRIVEGIGANDADVAGDRVERFDAAGKRAGMGHGGVPSARRMAELDGDDRFARGPRGAAGGLEFRQLRDRLDIDDDDLELGLGGEESDVIGDAEAGFVAAGDKVVGMDAALLQRLVGEDHHAAALADERNRAGLDRQRAVLGQGDEAAARTDIAEAIRARDRKPGLRNGLGELAAECRGRRVEALAEAGGKHRGAAGARGSAAAQGLDHARRRHQHNKVIGRLRQRLEIGIAGLAPQVRSARIDQVDRSGELVAVEIVPHPR